MISLDVGVNYVLDLHPLRTCESKIRFKVMRLWVHDRGPCFSRSTKDVSGTASVVIKKLFEDHRGLFVFLSRIVGRIDVVDLPWPFAMKLNHGCF